MTTPSPADKPVTSMPGFVHLAVKLLYASLWFAVSGLFIWTPIADHQLGNEIKPPQLMVFAFCIAIIWLIIGRIKRGRAFARKYMVIVCAFSIVFVLGVLGNYLEYFDRETIDPSTSVPLLFFGILVGFGNIVLELIALILLYQKQSSDWFRGIEAGTITVSAVQHGGREPTPQSPYSLPAATAVPITSKSESPQSAELEPIIETAVHGQSEPPMRKSKHLPNWFKMSLICAGALAFLVIIFATVNSLREAKLRSGMAKPVNLEAAKPLNVDPSNLIGTWHQTGKLCHAASNEDWIGTPQECGETAKDINLTLTITGDERLGAIPQGVRFHGNEAQIAADNMLTSMRGPTYGTIQIEGLGQHCSFNLNVSGTVHGQSVDLGGDASSLVSEEEFESDSPHLQRWQDDDSNRMRAGDGSEYVELTDKVSLDAALGPTDMRGEISLVSAREGCPSATKLRVDLPLVNVPAPASAGANDWDTGRAMAQVFGSDNQALRTWTWKDAPKDILEGLDSETLAQAHGTVAVRPALEFGFTEGNSRKHFLMTTAAPAGVEWDCHACISVIGAFEFVSENNQWVLEAGNKTLFEVYEGQLPPVHLLPVGSERFGFTFETSEMANGGDGEKSIAIVVPNADKLVVALNQETATYQGGDVVEAYELDMLPSQDVEARPEHYKIKITERDWRQKTISFSIYEFDALSGEYRKMDPRFRLNTVSTVNCFDVELRTTEDCWTVATPPGWTVVSPHNPPSETDVNGSQTPSTSSADSQVQSGPEPQRFMVQVAAVSQEDDANELMNDLRRHSYIVSAARSPADNLFHVRIGPFSNRNDAIAMREKLLGDGFNAIVLP